MSALKREIKPQMSTHKTRLGPAKLCLDDVRDLLDAVKVFQEDSTKKEKGAPAVQAANEPSEESRPVTLLAGNAVAESVDDLKEATPEELGHISIVSREPRIEIDLWHAWAEVTVDTQDVTSRAFADSVAKYIKERRVNPLTLALRISDWLIAPSFLVLGVFLCFFYPERQTALSILGTLFLGGAFAGPGFRVYWVRKLGSVKIDPVWRNEKRRLSSQARINIAIAIGAALLGAAITSVAGLWQGWFVK